MLNCCAIVMQRLDQLLLFCIDALNIFQVAAGADFIYLYVRKGIHSIVDGRKCILQLLTTTVPLS